MKILGSLEWTPLREKWLINQLLDSTDRGNKEHFLTYAGKESLIFVATR